MDSKSLSRSIVMLGMGLCLAFALIAIVPPSLAHASTVDSSYKFSMSYKGTSATPGRAKANDSSTYVNISSITNPCRMYVDGAKSKSGSWTNCTVRGYANAKKTGNWRIMNYVNEWGYSYARLTAWANSGSTSVRGYWSPDCAGSYSAINAS